MAKLIKFLMIIFISIMLFLFLYLNSGTGHSKNINLLVKKGTTFHKIANVLYKKKIIKSKLFFLACVKAAGAGRNLKEGYYDISDRLSSIKIIKILTKGNVITKTFTIPEGFNVYQIANLLNKKKIIQDKNFLTLVTDNRIIKKYNIKSYSLEGYLYPDTYTVEYNINSEKLIDIMVKNFFTKINKLYFNRMKKLGYSLNYTVKLASLVEWEAKSDFERPLIASVFINRLARNLNLGSCATVLYALGHHKKRLLFRDLKTNSEYNTYIYKGLPPTPICNPGKKSILAVLYPAKENYLYFVSMKNGRHYFSKTYSEHLQAYKKYIAGH